MTGVVSVDERAEIAKAIGGLDARVSNLCSRLAKIETAIEELRGVAAFGRGALWAAIKAGAFFAAAVGALAYLWKQFTGH